MAWLLRDGEVLASLEVADDASPPAARGCSGRDGIDGALLLSPARSVHTFGMRLPDRRRLLDERPHRPAHRARLRRHRMTRPVLRRARVLEAEAGAFARWGLAASATSSSGRTEPVPLVLVGTPIGNLGDLSPRAVEALAGADADLLRGHPPHRPAAPARRRRPRRR